MCDMFDSRGCQTLIMAGLWGVLLGTANFPYKVLPWKYLRSTINFPLKIAPRVMLYIKIVLLAEGGAVTGHLFTTDTCYICARIKNSSLFH